MTVADRPQWPAMASCLAGSELLQIVADSLAGDQPHDPAADHFAFDSWCWTIASMVADAGLLDSVARSLGPTVPVAIAVPGRSPKPPLLFLAPDLLFLPGLRCAGAGGGGPGSVRI